MAVCNEATNKPQQSTFEAPRLSPVTLKSLSDSDDNDWKTVFQFVQKKNAKITLRDSLVQIPGQSCIAETIFIKSNQRPSSNFALRSAATVLFLGNIATVLKCNLGHSAYKPCPAASVKSSILAHDGLLRMSFIIELQINGPAPNLPCKRNSVPIMLRNFLLTSSQLR